MGLHYRYLFKIARLIQERSREFAVLESLDGGKPIKESRDFDLPQVAANFFYFAGWADKLDLSWSMVGFINIRKMQKLMLLNKAVKGVLSAGFKTTVFPVASAGATFHASMWNC